MGFAKLIERRSDGGEDQGAEEVFMRVYAKRELVTSVLEAVSRASGSPFSAGIRASVRVATCLSAHTRTRTLTASSASAAFLSPVNAAASAPPLVASLK